MTTQPATSVPRKASPPPAKRRVWLFAGLMVGALILLLVGTAVWYASTPQFQRLVRAKLIATLEQATGGRVELQSFRWSLRHLAFEADGLTIHGLEARSEAPYAHVDRIYVRVKILSLFGPKRMDLNYVEADHPAIHLIIYPDGSTNQPRPKTEREGKPLNDTLFDLQVGRTEIRDGVALINEQVIPFNLAANNLGVVVSYSAPNDHYLATLHAADIVAQRGKLPRVRSLLDVFADIGRNVLKVSQFQLETDGSVLKGTASLNDFVHPRWDFSAKGKIDVREVMALEPVDGVDRGVASLDVEGQGTGMRLALDGQVSVTDAAYHSGTFHVSGASTSMTLQATENDLMLTNIRTRLAQGGTVNAEMRVANWLGIAVGADGEAKPAVRRGTIRSKINGISLRTVMDLCAPARYRELGFDTLASGDGNVDWTGYGADLTAKAVVTLTPSVPSPAGEVPMSGTVNATYFERNGTVQIDRLRVQTPAMQAEISGALGVYPLSRRSNLQVNLETSDLGEFDRALSTLGLTEHGQRGVQALPVRLQGEGQFNGVVSGNLNDPGVKGHITASSFDLLLPRQVAQAAQPPTAKERVIHWDSLAADAEYSSELISVHQATLTRGRTTIHASGTLRAHNKVFDDESGVNADIQLKNAAVGDLLEMVGQNLPITGTLNLDAHGTGQLTSLNGGGRLSVQGGQIYGEPYRSLNADLHFADDEIGVAKLTFLQNGGQVTGNGGYRIRAKQFHFTAEGKGFDLAHVERFRNSRIPLTGQLVFSANGSGAFESPIIQATAHLNKVQVGSEANGEVNLDAHTSNRNLLFTANGRLASAQLQINGQTELSGDYATKARAELANFDINPFLEMFHVEGVQGHSSIAGVLDVTGPLRTPRQMQGQAQFSRFALTLAGRPLRSEGPLHAELRNGTLSLDPVRLVGENTDMLVQGQIGVLHSPQTMHLQAQGAVSLQLLHSINPSVTSSGQVTFSMNARGTIQNPDLTGQVKVANVALSFENVPNGLSQLNGTLEFNQDRLQVKSLTGTTGGGQVNVTGYVTYQQGIYTDLTATGKQIRIRYPTGISSMVDTKLRLQGTPESLTLSGNILLTRFTISPDLDFASFTASSGAAPPPDPNAFSNRVRLNIHMTSSPDLDFQNSYARLAGDVDLRVRGTIAQPSVLGHITITEGSATFAGTKYELQHGEIYFSNPVRINPVIDLDATARIEDYDITIGLHGTTDNLSPSFRSEPPLAQQDIFSLLAMGRTQEEQQIYTLQAQQAGVNTAADALLGGALNATISSRVQKLFGGGSVKIDPSWVGSIGNSTARITVSQQVTKNATLTYATSINSTAQQLIQGEFNVTHNISILAVRDESGVFSMMFKVHKRYR